MKKTITLSILAALVCAAPAFAQDFGTIQKTLNNTGVVADQVLRMEFPRDDLNVKIGNVDLEPDAGVKTELTFQQAGAFSNATSATSGAFTNATSAGTTSAGTTGTTGTAFSNITGTRTGFSNITGTSRSALNASNTTTGTTTGAVLTNMTSAATRTASFANTTSASAATSGTTAGGITGISSAATGIIVTGDICVTDTEEPKVVSRLLSDGFEITAIHEHLLGESPDVRFVHFEGVGGAATVASKVKDALSQTATHIAQASKKTSTVDWSTVQGILGQTGTASGKVLTVEIPRKEAFTVSDISLKPEMGAESEIAFQSDSSGQASVNAELCLLASEVGPAISSLEKSGLKIAALHNHFLMDNPRFFFVHAFGTGSSTTMAQAVKDVIDMMGTGVSGTTGVITSTGVTAPSFSTTPVSGTASSSGSSASTGSAASSVISSTPATSSPSSSGTAGNTSSSGSSGKCSTSNPAI
jgi:hypothetical protein